MQTVGEVRKLIKKAKTVYVRPYFGIMERWVKVSKAEAIAMFDAYDSSTYLYNALDFDHTLSIEDDGSLCLG